jgi:predicted dehydrogenase
MRRFCMGKIRIGMIGVGQIAKMHLESYKEIPDAEIVAAADINEKELKSVSERYKIGHIYKDFKEMLLRDDLDAVDVCLHNHYHASATVLALRAGKNVYCEKPIAGTYADGKMMVDTAKECGKKLHVQLSMLFQRETKFAKRLIDNGRLGEIYLGRSTGYRRRGRPFVDGYASATFVNKEITGGGAIFDMAIYKLSQILYLMGTPEVERLSGKTFQKMDMYEDRRLSSGYNVEELGLGFIRFKNGAVLDLIEAWAINLDEFDGSSLVGTKGGIRLYPFKYISTIDDIEMTSIPDFDTVDERWHRINPLESAYDSSQKHWIAALQGKVDLLNTAEIALRCMLIQQGIYFSDTKGCEISAEEIISSSVSKAVKL